MEKMKAPTMVMEKIRVYNYNINMKTTFFTFNFGLHALGRYQNIPQ